MSEISDTEKAVAYYKSGVRGWVPPFVPKRIITGSVRGDGPFFTTHVPPGEYECYSNRYGALSVKATNGQMLGIKPTEFEVVEWQPNPHLKGEQNA